MLQNDSFQNEVAGSVSVSNVLISSFRLDLRIQEIYLDVEEQSRIITASDNRYITLTGHREALITVKWGSIGEVIVLKLRIHHVKKFVCS